MRVAQTRKLNRDNILQSKAVEVLLNFQKCIVLISDCFEPTSDERAMAVFTAVEV